MDSGTRKSDRNFHKSLEKPREYPHKPYTAKQSLGYIFTTDSIGLPSFKFSRRVPKMQVF